MIRAQRAETAILMLTGRTSELDTVAGLDAGADDYVAKPFRVAELLARVRAHVRRAGGDEILRAGDVRVDRAARRAFHGERGAPAQPARVRPARAPRRQRRADA